MQRCPICGAWDLKILAAILWRPVIELLETTLLVHPQFAGSAADDIYDATHRSPYPTLHLLREACIARAVAAFPEPDRLLECLDALGPPFEDREHLADHRPVAGGRLHAGAGTDPGVVGGRPMVGHLHDGRAGRSRCRRTGRRARSQ